MGENTKESIWMLDFDDDRYRSISPIETSDWSKFNAIHTRMLSVWEPISVFIWPLENDPRTQGDFFSIGVSLPVVTERVWNVLVPLIQHQVELLPLNWDVEKLWLINPLYQLDCYDKEKSKFYRFSQGDQVFNRWIVFEEKCLDTLHIFTITFSPSRVYVSDDFKLLVEDNQLKGFIFTQVSE